MRLVQRPHLQRDRSAEMNARDRRLGHRNDEPQPMVVGQLDDRPGLRLRRGAGLDHRAGVGVAARDHAAERRRDPRVREQRGRLALGGLGEFELLARGGQRGGGRRDLRFRDVIAPGRFVDVLLRDQIRPRGDDLGEPRRSQMRDVVDGFRAVQIGARAVDLLLRALDRGLVLLQFVLQFGNLEDGEQLPGLDPVADVHADRLQEAGDLRVHVDFLVRPELRRDREDLGQVAARDLRDRDGRRVAGRRLRRVRVRSRTRRGAGERRDGQTRRGDWKDSIHGRCLTATRSCSRENEGDWHKAMTSRSAASIRSATAGTCATIESGIVSRP